MKLVKVTWLDAVTENGWTDIDEIKREKLHRIRSVGYLAHKGRKRVVLVSTIGGTQGNCHIVIPRSWIVKMQTLTHQRG